ncbi:hypothetical protein TNCV_2619131 [Trichonephila clavipes]|uniref:Uncharacterized protein n=1 Tax=Trichonephila clavipes TaxID=2585209 RepID=A0A8X6WJF8_TRICX|nr:hypothetical protein TNCV_2619131 [Trichonephila clavipes]
MAVTDPQKANLLANTIKNNRIENNRMQDNYDQDDEVVTSTVNTFSLPPSTQIEPAMPDEIINFIKNTSSKKAPVQVPKNRLSSTKQAKSERKLPPTSTSPRHIGDDASSMEEGESTAEESSEEVGSAKTAKPVIAPSSPAAKAAESASAPGTIQHDDGFTTVGRKGKRIAPIVIDAQSNATELLTQIGNLCNNTTLEGRFEKGETPSFPNFCRRAPYHPEICLGQKNAVPHIRDGPQ